MDMLSETDLKGLMTRRNGTCVSIYMPTHRVGLEVQQDPIRLKNVVKRAEELLVAEGMRSPDARDFLKPAQNLVADNLFWSHQSDGLAVFLARNHTAIHRLPLHFDEVVVVTDRFHLKPILALLSGDGLFHILALSRKSVRLFKASRFSAQEIELPGVVKSIDETLRYDVFQKQTTWHGQSRQGQSGAILHGGGAADAGKEDVIRFCRDVDRGLQQYIGKEQAPLVLACVEDLFPLYKEVNTYPRLMDEWIQGNPDGLNISKLHKSGWALVEPVYGRDPLRAAEKYKELAGTGKTEKDLKLVVRAAVEGRIDTLFVALGLERWGVYDQATGDVAIRSERQPGDEDLLDLAAIETHLNGGRVFAVEREDVPDDRSVAAILRY